MAALLGELRGRRNGNGGEDLPVTGLRTVETVRRYKTVIRNFIYSNLLVLRNIHYLFFFKSISRLFCLIRRSEDEHVEIRCK